MKIRNKIVISILVIIIVIGVFILFNLEEKQKDESLVPQKIEIDLSSMFPNSINQDLGYISSTVNIEADHLESYYMLTGESFSDSLIVVVLKPKLSNRTEVKKQMEQFYQDLYNWISTYSKEVGVNINNRIEKELNGYLIYIISNKQNDEIYSLITKSIV